MRKTVLAAVVVSMMVMPFTDAARKSKSSAEPEKGMVVGEVIDIASFAMKGNRGAEYVDAGQSRASKGFPIGVLEEETGDVWLCVYKNPAPASSLETANKVLSPYMGKKVVVQGMKHRKNGVNLIRIAIVGEY